MKKEFFGFYDPTKQEIDKAWDEGAFVFDANALLNLYRYSESTREDLIKGLESLKEKLFMPFQVGYEFHTNRHGVIKGMSNLFDSIPIELDEHLKTGGAIDSVFSNAKRHPSIDLKRLVELKEEFSRKVKEELKTQSASHPDFLKEDPILERLNSLFEEKVGISFSESQLESIYSEGKERYIKRIPPGYKDQESKKNLGNQRIYGDLIIWKQVIEFAVNSKKPIVLITDDRKEDWWTIEKGKTIRPREELIKEFFDKTGTRLLIYSSDGFLKYAKERGVIEEVKEDSITEVQKVRRDDEAKRKIFESDINDLMYSGSDWQKLQSIIPGKNFRYPGFPGLDDEGNIVYKPIEPFYPFNEYYIGIDKSLASEDLNPNKKPGFVPVLFPTENGLTTPLPKSEIEPKTTDTFKVENDKSSRTRKKGKD